MGVHIIIKWKILYQGNKKAFLLPGLITALFKRAGVPWFDANEVLPMDTPIHPLLVWEGCSSTGKMRRTNRASSSREVKGYDGEDPLSGARMEEDLAAVLGRAFLLTLL